MKTIEEGAIQYENERLGMPAMRYETFVAGAEFVQRWIPVKEELPEENTHVLCKLDFYLPFVGYLKHGVFCHSTNHDKYQVTHWRPINYEL